MKIQLDTRRKTIKVEEKVNLNELLESVKKLFPNGEWKEYSLETNTVINWNTNPIIIKDYVYPTYPWIQQPYYGTPGNDIQGKKTNDFTYCVEMN